MHRISFALLFTFIGFAIGAVVFVAASIVLAWTGPASAPPNDNVDAPINVGIVDQIKNAGLGLNSLAVFGNAFISGANRYINFGTTTASGSDGYGIRDNNGVMEFRNSGGEWTPIGSGGSSGSGTSFTISSDTQNANLYVIAGSPAAADNYTITINAGVTVGSASTGSAALQTGVWPAGSTVTLVNNGNIYGSGGNGGAGGSSTSGGTAGGVGGAGGPAFSLGYNIIIDNTNGSIFGGGGGGGGGYGSYNCVFGCTGVGGNGGGGGQGSAGGAGGAGGTGIQENGGAGGSGSVASPGAGSTYTNVFGHMPGANGGAWGSVGGTSTSGRPGGAGGAAILLNGKTITWLSGNNGAQVKGAVQ